MFLIPVLDLKDGCAVHAIGGRREHYQPVRSRWIAGSEPFEIARELVALYQPKFLYLADLNAISGSAPACEVYHALQELPVCLWIDAGVRYPEHASCVAPYGKVVLGLETLSGPDTLKYIIEVFGPEHLVFSLDMKNGTLLGNWQAWGIDSAEDAIGLAGTVFRTGIGRMILLDLARVGEGQGAGTERLCTELTLHYPESEIICGGGVRGIQDLHALRAAGASGVLVASALHDGRITPEDWRAWQAREWPTPTLPGSP